MEWYPPKHGMAFRRFGAILHLWLVFSLLLSPAGAPLARAGVEAAQPTTGVQAATKPGRALPVRVWPVLASRQGPRPPSDAARSPHPIRASSERLTAATTLGVTLWPTATATLTPTLAAGPSPTSALTPTLATGPSSTATTAPTSTPIPAPTATPPADEPGIIRPDTGGVLRSADGRVTVQFPPGAVERPIRVDHQPLPPVDLPPDRHLFYRFELNAQAVDGTDAEAGPFTLPVTVTVAYSDTEVTRLDEAGLRLVTWDEALAAWTPLAATVDLAANRVTARLAHFSAFALEGEDEVYFLPRIEAGQVALLTADSSFRYELEVPAGAGGLKLPLTSNYSGGIPNGMTGVENTDTGWVGVGWTLELGSIGQDGGWLTLNGQSSELIWIEPPLETATATESDWDGGSYTGERSVFQHWLREQEFLKIESDLFSGECVQGCPVGAVQGKGQWEAWDRSGVHYTFGSQPYAPKAGGCELPGGSTVECGTGSQLSSTDSDGGRRLYRVYKLDTAVDPHGNRLTVEYDVYPVQKAGGINLKESYPAHIYYTTNLGAGDTHAEYEVEFVVAAKDHDMRADKRVAETGYLLQEVRVWVHPDVGNYGTRSLLRKYVLGYYDHDETNREHYRLTSITEYGTGVGSLPSTQFEYYYDAGHKIGWLEGGQNKTAPRPFLQWAKNNYGGLLSYGYQTWSGSNWTQRQLANSQTVSVEGGTAQAFSYSYQNADIETQGTEFKSFIGFEYATEESAGGNRRRVTRFYDTNGYARDVKRGKVLEEWTKDLQNVEYGYRQTEYQDGRQADWNEEVHFIYASRVTERVCGSGVCGSKKTEYEYDAGQQDGGQYGNLTAVKEYASDAATTPYRTTRRWYFPNTSAWIVDRLAAEGVWAGEWGAMASAMWYYYDERTDHRLSPLTKGELTRVQRLLYNRDEGGWTYWDTAEESYGYDAYGNRTTEMAYTGYGQMRQQGNTTERVVSPGGARTTTTAYDGSHHTFAVLVTPPLNLQEETKYYGVNGPALGTAGAYFGRVSSVRDVKNNDTTSYQYDSFGRPAKVIRPYDTASYPTVQYDYDDDYAYGGNHYPQVKETLREKSGVAGAVQVNYRYYDGLGRRVETLAERTAGGEQVLAYWSYDALGRVQTEYVPYVVNSDFGNYKPLGAGKTGTTYGYDTLGRTTRVTSPDGSYVQRAYSGWKSAAVDENGHQRVSETDAFGRLTWVGEYLGQFSVPNFGATAYATTAYGYDVADELTQVTDAAGNVSQMTYSQLGYKTAMSDPDMGGWSYTYDAAGNLKTQKDARNQTILFEYDDLNRLTRKDYPTGSDVYLQYDNSKGDGTAKNSWGRLRVMYVGTEAGNGHLYEYDSRGRVVKEIVKVDSSSYTTQYGYDAMDRVATMTYPDAEVLTVTYDDQGLPETLVSTQNGSYVDGASYDALGQPELWTLGGSGLDLQVTWEYYSDDQRLYRLRGGTSGTPGRDLDLQYVYDNVGNVTQISDQRGGVFQYQTLTYDALDRLTQGYTSGTGTWGTYDEDYAYNSIGNLTNKDGVSYSYPSAGQARPHAVTSTSAGGSFSYDLNGNMTSRLVQTGGTTYSQIWDAENRLASVTAGGQTTAFTYDGNGALVKKVAAGQTTVYLGDYYEKQGSAVTKYYYFYGQRVAMRTASGLSYLAGDHLGTTSVTWNSSGGKAAEGRHLPYGGERWTSGTMPTDYRFTGQRLTAGLGLYQMGARWYDPSLGRWLSADSLAPDPNDPQSFNRYYWVRNNPLKFVDPTGHKEEGACSPGDESETCKGDEAVYEESWAYCTENPGDAACQPGDPIEVGFWFLVGVSGGIVVEDLLLLGGGLLEEGVAAAFEQTVSLSASCLLNPFCAATVYGVSSAGSTSQAPRPRTLLRWVHPKNLQPNGEPMSLGFRDPQMSAFDTSLGATPEKVLNVMSGGTGQGAVYALDPGRALQVPGVTQVAPELGTTGDRILDVAHFVVHNTGTKAVARALRDLAVWVLGGKP